MLEPQPNPTQHTSLQTPGEAPTCSLMVAYRLFASGQLLRLHSPVTLYSLRQKFWVCVLALKLQWWWLITCTPEQKRGG